jgi:hypothetical protein
MNYYYCFANAGCRYCSELLKTSSQTYYQDIIAVAYRGNQAGKLVCHTINLVLSLNLKPEMFHHVIKTQAGLP